MKMRFLLLLIGPLMGGCAATTADTNKLAELEVCEEPRPQVCTMDYRPVCASLIDGGQKTYSNGCSACADNSVEGWRDEACAE